MTIYRGTAFPAEYRGNAFIGDVGGNLVHRKVLTRAGSIFRATRADEGVEFLVLPGGGLAPVAGTVRAEEVLDATTEPNHVPGEAT